jgi:hypothetical protein
MTPPRVRVEPTSEDFRRVLKHPRTGVGFRTSGSIEWPDDRFTKMRIKNGSVRIAERQEAGAAPEVAEETGQP